MTFSNSGTDYFERVLDPWDVATYPDEAGFQGRIRETVAHLAAQKYGRGKAKSTCPDTGLPMESWALEGEDIISPYSGRRFKQGPTGYFGPLERDAEGRITRFGGDPLKYDLPVVTARLLMVPDDSAARSFLSIPGNLRQQYHFAAMNWVRLYGLLHEKMDAGWHAALREAVAEYAEARHASDGSREHLLPVSVPFTLVGEPGELLGGNRADGGTENHKTQWRTSALLYAQWFGSGAAVSGCSCEEAQRLVLEMLQDFAARLSETGNGEYDSSIYYVYTIASFLNLYDFSPDPQTRALAKFVVDYFLATYGMKLLQGRLIGAGKRGFAAGPERSDTDRMYWVFCPPVSGRSGDAVCTSLHQATTNYRPNRVISRILRGEMSLPFEARMRRPSYHMDRPNVAHETFVRGAGYALGSIILGEVDNPNQQTVWSLGLEGDGVPCVVGGGQPRHRNPCGHSPHDQVFQVGASMILVSGENRVAGTPLVTLSGAVPAAERWQKAPELAESWLFVLRGQGRVVEEGRRLWIHTGKAAATVTALGTPFFELTEGDNSDKACALFSEYRVFVTTGRPSGFVVEAGGCGAEEDFESFRRAIERGTMIDDRAFAEAGRVTVRNAAGREIAFRYNPEHLKPEAVVDGVPVDYGDWANGRAYDSPVIRTGDGRIVFSGGHESYSAEFRNGQIGYSACHGSVV